MGPPPFDGGNPDDEPHQSLAALASMGPPPFDGGNSACRFERRFRPLRFNGATAFRRWKLSRPNEPVKPLSMLQWGHRLSTVETPSAARGDPGARSFNGATAFRRWKLAGSSGQSHDVPIRFNGATAFRRWKLGGCGGAERLDECFNGATAFRRWKRADFANQCIRREAASMGPPPSWESPIDPSSEMHTS